MPSLQNLGKQESIGNLLKTIVHLQNELTNKYEINVAAQRECIYFCDLRIHPLGEVAKRVKTFLKALGKRLQNVVHE